MTGNAALAHLVVSVLRPGDLYYAGEVRGPGVEVVYTREAPAGDARGVGRLALADVMPLVVPGATAYVCGSSPFSDAATDLLIEGGVGTADIRVERFGPSG
jgi:ferredoxin-NADP reductase